MILVLPRLLYVKILLIFYQLHQFYIKCKFKHNSNTIHLFSKDGAHNNSTKEPPNNGYLLGLHVAILSFVRKLSSAEDKNAHCISTMGK